MPEQLSSFEQQREALAEKLKLREQYEQQIKTLNETGILEILPDSQELGIIGIDSKGYPIPTYEQILQRITPEKLELLDKKFQQGFTKLLLVPFGMPLEVLIDRYKRELLKHDQEGTLFSADGQKMELDRKDPIYAWRDYHNPIITGEFVYDPKELSLNHQGKTKIQLIEEKSSWQVILTEDIPDLPGEGKGETIQGRKQLEVHKHAEEYLRLVQTDPQYQGEAGFHPDSWLILAITYLHQKDIQIEDWEGIGKMCFLIGSYLKNSRFLPFAGWHRPGGRAMLGLYGKDWGSEGGSTRTRVEI
jgi:hypothetical protein